MKSASEEKKADRKEGWDKEGAATPFDGALDGPRGES